MSEPLSVLFVEDVEDDSVLLARELRKGGFIPSCVRVETPEQLIDALRDTAWDVILSDYSLPNLDGPTSLKIVLEHAPDTPFILISGTVGEEIAVESIKAGASDYLMKDNLIRLVPAVRRAVRDAADRRSARLSEMALRQSQQILSLIYHHVSDFLMLAERTEDGVFRFISINRAYREILNRVGFSVEEADLIGRSGGEVDERIFGLSPEVVAQFECLRQQAIEAGKPVQHERIISGRDTEVTIEVTYTPLIGSDGTCTHLLTTGHDVTESRTAQRREQELRDRLSHSQKMEALGRLAGGIAHDFNNLLTGILGFTELALADPLESATHLGIVQSTGRRAAELVQQILAFARRQRSERRPVNVAGAIREVAEFLKGTLPPNISCEIQLPSMDITVLADAGQLNQVLVNLCRNAIQAMTDRGKLTIRLTAMSLYPESIIGLPDLSSGEYAVLEIRDTGPGMTPEVQSRIFEPFFTTKPAGQGTGLGLAVVHGIVTDHHGAITVKSALGTGTSVFIYLPMVAQIENATAEASAPPVGNGQRILLIEDDPTVLAVTTGMLKQYGYVPEPYRDPVVACRQFAANPKQWNAIITDFTMPGFTGREVIEFVRGLPDETPILLISGSFSDSELIEWDKYGRLGLLPKPYHSSNLARAISSLLSRD